MREAAQRISAGVALPDDVHMAGREIDRLAVAHLARDVEPARRNAGRSRSSGEQPARRAVSRAEMLEQALAPDTGIGVFARRIERRVFVRSHLVDGNEGVHAAGRKGDDPRFLKRSATSPGRNVFIAQVSGWSALEPNLRPAMKTTFRARGRSASAFASSRSARIVSTPHSQLLPDSRLAESRDADDPPAGRGAPGHPREGGPFFRPRREPGCHRRSRPGRPPAPHPGGRGCPRAGRRRRCAPAGPKTKFARSRSLSSVLVGNGRLLSRHGRACSKA